MSQGFYNSGAGSGSGSYQYSYQATDQTSSPESSNDFGRLAQLIGSNIQKMSQNVNQMQKMVNQIGTGQDSDSFRNQLHQVQHYTNQLAKDTNNNLKELSHIPQSLISSEQRERKMMKERLYNEFSTALGNFQQLQRSAASREKDSVKRARANSGLTGGPFDKHITSHSDNNLLDLSSPSQPHAQQAQENLQMEEEVNIELIKEREQAVRQLESDISDVNQIFKDLATLVHEQGDVIDSIEANVETAAIQVNQGTQQLAKARQLKSKARRKKFCLAMFGVCILIILITVIAVMTTQKK